MARKKISRKKAYRRNKKTVGKNVRKYVRAQIARNIETKEMTYSTDVKCDLAAPTTWNINYQAAGRGTTELNFIGNGYKMQTLEVKFVLTNYQSTVGLTTVARQPVFWILGIVHSKDYATTTSLTSTQLFDPNFAFGGGPNTYFKSTNRAKFLKYRIVRIETNPADLTIHNTRSFTLYHRFNKVFNYRDFDISYEGKNGNYYIVAMPLCPTYGTQALTQMQCSMSYRLKFKDA